MTIDDTIKPGDWASPNDSWLAGVYTINGERAIEENVTPFKTLVLVLGAFDYSDDMRYWGQGEAVRLIAFLHNNALGYDLAKDWELAE